MPWLGTIWKPGIPGQGWYPAARPGRRCPGAAGGVPPQGGRLEQYDTPAALLGAPASPFVREFVGADRGIRRLAVTRVSRDALAPLPDGAAGLPALPLGGSAYDALAAMLTAGSDAVVVTADGEPVGALSRARVLELGQIGT